MDTLSLIIGAISGGALVAIFYRFNQKSNPPQNDMSFFKNEIEN
jgi:hypothetical protein